MDFSKLKELTIPEGVVMKIINANNIILWEQIVSRIPNEYQEVEWIKSQNQVYIDLGFSFDTSAEIYMSQWVYDINTIAYPFGAAENDGNLRCMLSSPYGGEATLYGSESAVYQSSSVAYQGSDPTNGYKNEFCMILKNKNRRIMNVTNMTQNKATSSATQDEYTMTNNLYLFAQNYNGSARTGGVRQIGYFKYYDKNGYLICDLVPCYRKSDGEIGMYDIVRKVFLINAGNQSFKFVKGSDVEYKKPKYTNLVPLSTDENGNIYNDCGYKNGYRVRSGGAEVVAEYLSCTGFIPCKAGDTLNLCFTNHSNIWTDYSSQMTALNFSDSNKMNLGQFTSQPNEYGIFTSDTTDETEKVIKVGYGVWRYKVIDDPNIAYVRFTVPKVNDTLQGGSHLIVTVNDKIY